jgi:CRISPR-associated endonuclease Csn1
MKKRTLGLDLGPNSIGWALVEEDSKTISGQLIDMGVRVFTEGLDAFDTAKESSRNEKRRVARGMRRQTARRRKRRQEITEALISLGLGPSSASKEQRDNWMRMDPYELRAKAVNDTMLEPLELGRIFLHLAKRRGFLSNRKTDASGTESEGLLHEIQENEAKRLQSGHPTLGSWLDEKQRLLKHTDRKEDDHVRRRHLSRKQYLHEFDTIWKAQANFHPELLTDDLRWGKLGRAEFPCKPIPRPSQSLSQLELFGIEGLLFFQRKMYWPTEVIGRCELEPKKRRCPIADRRFQKFRIWQELNNLRYVDPDNGNEFPLALAQRKLLFGKLWETEKLDFSKIRKALGFLESVKFNFERGERSFLKGNATDVVARRSWGKDWNLLDEQLKDEIIEALTNPNLDDRELIHLAGEKWRFTTDQIAKLMKINLPSGYGSLSLKAIQKLLPHLERGLVYSLQDEANSAIHAAGYLRRDQIKRRIYDFLPSPQVERKTPIGNIPNPVVKRTLTEVRKLVNAIIREYGKPDTVHIEMARNLKIGAKKRKEITRDNADRAKKRESIAEVLGKHGITRSRENILRYQLWQEQNHQCLYSGKTISIAQLLSDGGEVEIDHILPRSRTLDDSQTNKVLCFRDSNQSKGNRTPFEWLANSNPAQFEEIIQRANLLLRSGNLPYTKYKKLLQKEVSTDEFVSRQLVDTAYITKVTSEYLRCLFEFDHQILGLKGALTAELRWQWGLETILEEIPNSPAWAARAELRPGQKNRADHRHHAIDAVVIALTNRSRLQNLARSMSNRNNQRRGELMDTPWDCFRESIRQRVSRIWVSHRVERKISGALHEETHYGKTDQPDWWVTRKPVESLKGNEIPNIRDPFIRDLVISKLKEAGIDVGRNADIEAKRLKEAIKDLKLPSGVPIRKVRVLKTDKTVRSIRKNKCETHVKPGSTHHLSIFEWEVKGKKKRGAVFLTMLEASQRAKSGAPIIQRQVPPTSDSIPSRAAFVMSLAQREAVLVEDGDSWDLLIFRTAASTQGQMYFSHHSDARSSNDYKKIVYRANTLKGRKVSVDLLGRIRFAGD